MEKKMTAKTAARLINSILMEKDGRPEPKLMPSKSLVALGGRLKGGSGWRVTTVVTMEEDSISLSVQLPGGAKGYATDILTEFVDEETVSKYAHHALKTIYKRNGWTMMEEGAYTILDHATLKYEEESFPTFAAAKNYMEERRMNGSIYDKKTDSFMVFHFDK